MKFFRYIFYTLYAHYLIHKHTYERLKFEDRDVLERIILPCILINFNPKKILDIGREDYQHFYNKFFIGKELWTIDVDPEKAEFGAANHIIGSAADLKKHFRDDYFDFILFNGVFGWGLNKKDEIEDTFQGIFDILKPKGILVFGWNDIPDLVPVPLNEIVALRKFEPYYFKPLKGFKFKSNSGEHTYSFYLKPFRKISN